MNNEAHGNIEMVREEEFGSPYRWQHWIRALSIVALTLTGFYIADPFLTPAVNAEPTNFMQALIRSWHVIFGFVLISAVIFKSYLFLFTKKCSIERSSLMDVLNPLVWGKQIGYYLLVSKHPKLKGVYNPIQFMAYVTLYIMLFALIITGLILYVHVYHQGLGGALYDTMKSIEVMIGGLATVRTIHHILTWGIMLFVLGHVYMAVYNAVFGKEGGMDAIFSGLKWRKKD
ncbi:Ni/Fe-hydrogenase, b-type cytochrome subunit [Sulfurimonas sp.]|uniref:Ni/Fe-hydrogenase, b-type cytochrome subunit n=1 Tax=Sulfurimonas sp. TaxID=2022749 RepID=UPI002AB134AC|nr:Ni/Fe-hydrogenase, b-type cytochrome subunit [Sulfurimonas sp.]